ncbi:MAG TPA: ABC transporter permease [Candidatus Limnocylindrales bacterium]
MSFGLTIFTFMAIVVYCQWVAMSVAEEKSSRVMELILGAARPFELLAGKVIGVGGLGLLQLVVVAVAGGVALLLQDRVATRLLGSASSIQLPEGLTPELLVTFVVFFVLGFALYATLFAAVASLVSRQEDVNTLITPLILVAAAGYMIAIYSSLGVIALDSPLVIALSYIPFLSPYLMLTRVSVGTVEPIEPVAAALLLAATIVGALWVGGRLYSAGVLIYGQKASFRTLVTAFRRA